MAAGAGVPSFKTLAECCGPSGAFSGRGCTSPPPVPCFLASQTDKASAKSARPRAVWQKLYLHCSALGHSRQHAARAAYAQQGRTYLQPRPVACLPALQADKTCAKPDT